MERLNKNINSSAIAVLLVSLMFISLLTILSSNISYAQPDNMTFTSGEKIDFTSDTAMTFKSPTQMTFLSNVTMKFGTNITIKFIEVIPDGQLQPCDELRITWPIGYLPPQCSWWEVIDTLGKPLGEFHVDYTIDPDIFHIDLVYPGPIIMVPFGEVITAIKKIDIIEECRYYVVHWPAHWWPQPCSWWEILDPETGEMTGYEFHVDWTNESCEFHVDKVYPDSYVLPFPAYEVWARRKIPDIKPCDYFVVEDPPDWWPEPCTWWEIIDPSGEPTGLEFHVDWTNESCEFHVDEIIPDPLEIPWFPLPVDVTAEQKIVEIKPCDWFIIVDPFGFLPEPCSWWEILDDTGAPTGLEFHVDITDGIEMFHVDMVYPGEIITIPPSYTATVRKKIDIVEPCDWFRVDDPALTPATCSWWEILDPATDEPTGFEFHVDQSIPADGLFHVDDVWPEPFIPKPIYQLTAEKKIDDINPCDWFEVIDPPTGWLPQPCSWWEIIWPIEWAGITFHVDQSGDGIFHIDFVDDSPDPPIPPPWNVTARPYEEPSDQWYIKSPYPDYAPSGMPDFDQKQDMWGPGVGIYTWCGPVAVANSLWWFDSEYEYYNNPSSPPPPAISDSFPMVTAYGPWDDHDVKNVDPLVHNLAWLMDTDGQRTGLWHIGTGFIDMQVGISQYLQQQGINPVGDCDGDGDVDVDDIVIIEPALGSVPGTPNWNMAADIVIDNIIDLIDWDAALSNFGAVGMFYEHTEEFPDFLWIKDEIKRSEDVVLFLEFWQELGPGEWMPLYDNPDLEAGHYVTCAGVNSTTFELLISDPYQDAYEKGATPGRSPVPHPFPHLSDVHNDTQYVSHDAYNVTQWIEPPPSPYPGIPIWELIGYLQALGYDPSWHTFIRVAVVTSPLEPLPEPDIAVTNLTICRGQTICGQNLTKHINVTVTNEGSTNEAFTLTVYWNTTNVIATTSVSLLVGETKIVPFTWEANETRYLNYTLSAYATPVLGETDTADNNYVDGTVIIVWPGDVDADKDVDLYDAVKLLVVYGAKSSDPSYDPNLDINCDGKIDLYDAVTLLISYGYKEP